MACTLYNHSKPIGHIQKHFLQRSLVQRPVLNIPLFQLAQHLLQLLLLAPNLNLLIIIIPINAPHNIPLTILLLQLQSTALGHNPSLAHNHDPVRYALGFLHVVSGDQYRVPPSQTEDQLPGE